jgi:hypothetical protein
MLAICLADVRGTGRNAGVQSSGGDACDVEDRGSDESFQNLHDEEPCWVGGQRQLNGGFLYSPEDTLFGISCLTGKMTLVRMNKNFERNRRG